MFNSFQEMVDNVPPDWRKADVAIGLVKADGSKSCEIAMAVVRISLHSNANGQQIILLHTTELTPPMDKKEPKS